MGGGEEAEELDALLADWGLGGSVRAVNAGEEGREGIVGQAPGNGVELGGGHSQSVAVGELVEASYDSLPQLLSRPGVLAPRRATER